MAPNSAVLVCRSANARSIQKYFSDGISKHDSDLTDVEAARASRLSVGSAGPFAMVGPQATDEQQRISQKGVLAAIEADAEASAGLLSAANRTHFDRAMKFSSRVGINLRDARIAVAADEDLEQSDEEAGPSACAHNGTSKFKQFAAASKVCVLYDLFA